MRAASLVLLLPALLLSSFPAAARAATVSIPIPANLILPNYARVGVGQSEALEGGAFIARTDNALANWYNPAGLVQVPRSELNASASAYENVHMHVEGLTVGASSSRLASIGSFFGGVAGAPIVKRDNLRLGFSITTPVQWQPGTIDGAAQSTNGGTARDLGVTTQVSLSQTIPGLAAGFRVSPRVRLGLGLSIASTGITQRQSITLRQVSTDSALTVARSVSSDGSSGEGLVTLGGQWDATKRLTLGVRAMSPGLHLWGTSKLSYQAGIYSASRYQDLLIRDPEAKFEYRIPVTAGLGASWRLDHGSIEADVNYHGPTDSYSMYESDVQGVNTVMTGGTTTVTPSVLAPRTNSWRSVTNFAVGGNHEFGEHMRLHVGFYTDSSPVEQPGSSFFQKADLVGYTGGASWTWSKFSGSLGLGYSSGTSERVIINEETTGIDAKTRVKVSALRAAYAISFSF